MEHSYILDHWPCPIAKVRCVVVAYRAWGTLCKKDVLHTYSSRNIMHASCVRNVSATYVQESLEASPSAALQTVATLPNCPSPGAPLYRTTCTGNPPPTPPPTFSPNRTSLWTVLKVPGEHDHLYPAKAEANGERGTCNLADNLSKRWNCCCSGRERSWYRPLCSPFCRMILAWFATHPLF